MRLDRVGVLVGSTLILTIVAGLACDDWRKLTPGDRAGPDAVLVCVGAFIVTGAGTTQPTKVVLEREGSHELRNDDRAWVVGSAPYIHESQNKTFIATQGFVLGFTRAMLSRSYCLMEVYFENHGESDVAFISNEVVLSEDVLRSLGLARESDAGKPLTDQNAPRVVSRSSHPAFRPIQVGYQVDAMKYCLMASTELPAEQLEVLLRKEECGYYTQYLNSDVVDRLDWVPVRGLRDIVVHPGESNRLMLVFLPGVFEEAELEVVVEDRATREKLPFLFRWRAATYDEYWPPGSAYDWGGVWDPRGTSTRDAVDD